MSPATPARRGRPRKSDAPDTHVRLLAAAASACVDHGFDGATLQEIARRAGLTATAVYNHFASREDLLYAAGVRGLEQITEAAEAGAGERSEERRVGKGCVRQCRARWQTDHYNKKKNTKNTTNQ